jgi:hypothetical protein
MKVQKIYGKYYVNDLDLEEVMANRKYIINYIKKSIESYKDMLTINQIDNISSTRIRGKIKAYEDILEKLKLRK